MKRAFAYGISFFSIALLLGVWFIFPFFSFFWLLLLIAVATTPTAYVYIRGGEDGVSQQTAQRSDIDAVALSF